MLIVNCWLGGTVEMSSKLRLSSFTAHNELHEADADDDDAVIVACRVSVLLTDTLLVSVVTIRTRDADADEDESITDRVTELEAVRDTVDVSIIVSVNTAAVPATAGAVPATIDDAIVDAFRAKGQVLLNTGDDL